MEIKLDQDKYMNAILFVDDLVITSSDKNVLQHFINILNKVFEEYEGKIGLLRLWLRHVN